MRKRNLLALEVFVLLWATSLLILWILPVQSKFENEEDSLILIIVFVASISITATVWYELTKNIKFYNRTTKKITIEKIHFIIKWSTVSTLLGNAMVYFDRTVLRGIDYSQGFRDARYQWESSTISGSIISVLGNLMIPFSYCALFMGLFHWEILGKKYRAVALAAGFGGQFGIAMLNGGRSNIFLAIVFAFVVCVLRKYNKKSFLPKFNGRLAVAASAGIAVLYYVKALLYWIADNDVVYLRLVANMLGANVTPGYSGNPIINMITEIFLYILHGIYYISAVITSNPTLSDINHNMSFRWIFVVLSRTPFLQDYSMELPTFDGGGGNFIALPGILLYDYGYVGFVVCCIILGLLLGGTLRLLNARQNDYGMFELLVVIIVLTHLYMSMMTMALSFGYFMFMLVAMICMELIARIRYGDGGWVNI